MAIVTGISYPVVICFHSISHQRSDHCNGFFLYSSLVLGSMECLASKEDRLREGGLTFPICNATHMPHDHEMNDIL